MGERKLLQGDVKKKMETGSNFRADYQRVQGNLKLCVQFLVSL